MKVLKYRINEDKAILYVCDDAKRRFNRAEISLNGFSPRVLDNPKTIQSVLRKADYKFCIMITNKGKAYNEFMRN